MPHSEIKGHDPVSRGNYASRPLRLFRFLRRRGLIGTIRKANFAVQSVLAVRGKKGLKIGGPSNIFRDAVPVYSAIGSLDNCVFSTDAIWEGKRDDGAAFHFLPGKSGHNRVVDAVELGGIKDSEYESSCRVILWNMLPIPLRL